MARLATSPFPSCALNYLKLQDVQAYLEGGNGTRAAWRAMEAHFAAIRPFQWQSTKLDIGVASDVVLATCPVVLAAPGAPGHSAMLPGATRGGAATGTRRLPRRCVGMAQFGAKSVTKAAPVWE